MDTSASTRPWGEHRTENFVYRFPSDSPAAKDVTFIGSRLETVRGVMATNFELGESGDDPIQVFLVDMATDTEPAVDGHRI
jgi:hypothetical protein